jgi:hypothetical protein
VGGMKATVMKDGDGKSGRPARQRSVLSAGVLAYGQQRQKPQASKLQHPEKLQTPKAFEEEQEEDEDPPTSDFGATGEDWGRGDWFIRVNPGKSGKTILKNMKLTSADLRYAIYDLRTAIAGERRRAFVQAGAGEVPAGRRPALRDQSQAKPW